MSTIPLNDALKTQKFDSVSLAAANVDELTTAPGTIFLGSVTLENNFPKYMTIGDPDGGYLSRGANGKLFANSQLVRDSSLLVGDAQTEPGLVLSCQDSCHCPGWKHDLLSQRA